jgi:hypothetical protein
MKENDRPECPFTPEWMKPAFAKAQRIKESAG